MSSYEYIPASDDNVVDEAARAPIALFDYSAGVPADSAREPGLILTKEQLKNIKRYEIAGLSLPIELANVINYLGYTTGAGNGLDAVDFRKTFQIIHIHASSWNPLRVDLIAIGNKLELFAKEMGTHTATILEIRNDIRQLNTLDEYNIRTLEDVRRLEFEWGDKFPGIKLDDEDKRTVSEFSYYLNNILESLKQQEADANSIKFRLDAFATTLSNQVRPALQLKIRLIESNSLSDELKVLNEIIKQRALEIDEKVKEYKEAVRQSLGSAASFNIIGLAMSIYMGVEAERIRKERNRLRAEQRRDIAVMQTKNKILGSLNRVRFDLQDLDIIVVDADMATKNLVTVWNKLSIFIARSSQQADTIEDALSVRQFVNAFQLVAAPWKDIEQDANALLQVFAQADKEFREEYQQATSLLSVGV